MDRRRVEQGVVRKRFVITGQVQGVGFRPTVFRVAEALALTGWVRNAPEGVVVEAQGERAAEFPARLKAELPPLARILTLDAADAEPVPDEPDFRIRKSAAGTGHSVLISPDTATCPECQAEHGLDKTNRRFLTTRSSTAPTAGRATPSPGQRAL